MENSTLPWKKKGPDNSIFPSMTHGPFSNIQIVSKFASKTVFQDKSYKSPYSIPDTGEDNSFIC